MYIIIDKQDPERPIVQGIHTSKDEAVTSALILETKDSLFPNDEEDVQTYKAAMSFMNKNRYVRLGAYCIQEF